MTNSEFKEACALARNEKISLLNGAVDFSLFNGYGLPGFKPVACTIKQLAALIRWQCSYMWGDDFDPNALNEIRRIGKHKFMVV